MEILIVVAGVVTTVVEINDSYQLQMSYGSRFPPREINFLLCFVNAFPRYYTANLDISHTNPKFLIALPIGEVYRVEKWYNPLSQVVWQHLRGIFLVFTTRFVSVSTAVGLSSPFPLQEKSTPKLCVLAAGNLHSDIIM